MRGADGLLDDGYKLVKRLIFTSTEDTTDSVVLAGVCVGSRVGSAARAACVVDDTSDIVRIDSGSTSILVVETQEVVTNFLIGLDNNLIALSDVDGQDCGLIRLDRNKVSSNDSKLVSINVELVCGLDGTVEKLEQILLARNELSGNSVASAGDVTLCQGIDVHTIDQTAVHGTNTSDLSIVVHVVDRDVRPIVDDEVTSIHIEVSRFGTINVHGTEETFVCLKSQVTVVPGESVALSDPLVGHCLSGSQSALSNTNNTIHLVGVILSDAVPVNGSSIASHGVCDMDDNLVTPACLEKRTRELSVDTESLTADTIGSDGTLSQIETVLNLVASLRNNSIRIIVDGKTAVLVGSRLTFATNTGGGRSRLFGTSSRVCSNRVVRFDTSPVVKIICGRGRACCRSGASCVCISSR